MERVDYNKYSLLLEKQRKSQNKYLKLYDSIPLAVETPKLDIEKTLSDLNTEHYEFTGIIKSSEKLYNNLRTDLYYEFINITLLNKHNLSNWRYLYVPVIKGGVESFLPYIEKWDVRGEYPTSGRNYPDRVNIIETSSIFKQTGLVEILGSAGTHPFLPNLVFSKSVFKLPNSKPVYQYEDVKGYYGPENELYLSHLRPLNLNYPLGIPTEQHLYTNDCLQSVIGYYPAYGNFLEYPEEFAFTGRVTNKYYDPDTIYYLYSKVNKLDSESRGLILLEAPPHPRAKSYVQAILAERKYQVNRLKLFSNSQVNQSFEIIQESKANPIILKS